MWVCLSNCVKHWGTEKRLATNIFPISCSVYKVLFPQVFKTHGCVVKGGIFSVQGLKSHVFTKFQVRL